MRYYNFDRLIDKYTVPYTLLCAGEGEYNDVGDWVVTGDTEQEMQGAIIGINDTKVYNSNGVLTEKDKYLYSKTSLGRIDKAFVIYDSNKYSIQQEPNAGNSQFTGVYAYVLKWVSVFDKGGGST